MKTTRESRRFVVALGLFAALAAMPTPSQAGDPGADVYDIGPSDIEFGSLAPIVNESGQISVSIDGAGFTNPSGSIQVKKPSGATVRRAYLAAASTGFSHRKLVDGDIKLNGANVNWQISTPSSISSNNHWAEVTNLVKPTLDAAPPGIINVAVTEVNSTGIDGEILVVIFDDPNETTTNTVVLMFGAQLIAGDTFNVALGSPLNKADPNLAMDFSLGISFGFQSNGSFGQHSIVDVNGSRLTSLAGGQDDGNLGQSNGSLITVGGFDDSNSNTPSAGAKGERTDDELYNLLPHVLDGATTLTVFSRNPSNDDNIFFAALMLKSAIAIVGEGILAGPLPAPDSDTGTAFTVTAKVQNANGQPLANRTVTFTAFAGPHAGTTGTGVTDAAGNASFTYTGTVAGVDEIKATFVDSQNHVQTSNTVLKRWIQSNHAPSIVCIDVTRPVDASCKAIVQPAEVGIGTTDADDDPFSLALNPMGPFSLGTTNVVLTATDVAKMSSSCSAKITAFDDMLPMITCAPSATRECVANSSATFDVANATGGDNCGSATITGPAGSSSFPLGATALTFTAKDGSNNLASCTTTITVADTKKPTLSCTAAVSAECSGNRSATVTVPSPLGSDSCSGVEISGNSGPSVFPFGTTTVGFTAEDTSKNSESCSTTVTVVDTAKPTITCAAAKVAECTGNAGANVSVANAGATDVCGGVTVVGPAGLAFYGLGSTSLGFSATDQAGLAETCSTSVTVEDTIKPIIGCPVAITAECTRNESAQVTVPNAFASDSCTAVTVQGPAGLGTYPLGSSALLFSATDLSQNLASCSSAVTVVDTVAPEIGCPAAQFAECTGSHAADVDVPNAFATDACSAVAVTGPAGLASYKVGTSTLTFSAADTTRNAATCTSTVIVTDTTAPSISCPAAISAECTGNSSTTVNVPNATAGDICGAVAISGPAGAASYPLGTTPLDFSVVDDFENTAACVSSVTVSDTTPPTFDASTLAGRTVLGDCGGAAVTFARPVATDTCQAVTVTCTPVSGSSFGANTSTCTASDGSGNQTTATIPVNVLQPLRLAFQSPLSDDNVANNVHTDADVSNVFEVKRTIPNKIKVYACNGSDVTTSLGGSVTLRLTVTYRTDGSTGVGTSIVPAYTGVGDAGGTFVLTDGQFHYNQKTDPATYPSGSLSSDRYFDNIVSVTYNSAPSIVAGQEDARLESK